MTPTEYLAAIKARHRAWHDDTPERAEWLDPLDAVIIDGITPSVAAMSHELAREDVPRLVAAVEAVLFQCSGDGDNVYRDDNYGIGSRVICVDVVEAALAAALVTP